MRKGTDGLPFFLCGSSISNLYPFHVPRQSVDISPESRPVAQDAVKPGHALREGTYSRTHVDHGEEGADSRDVPLPRAEEYVAEHYRQGNQRDVHRDLHLGELPVGDLGYGNGDSLARHGHASASHLHGYAQGEYGASCDLRDSLLPERRWDQPLGKQHVHVDERPEEGADHQLEQLHPFEVPAQDEHLECDEYEIDDDGVGADSPLRHAQPMSPRLLEHVGQVGYDAGAYGGTHAYSHAECHHIERDGQQQVLPDKTNNLLFHFQSAISTS